jgi:class 3 adenylate cyclase
MRCQSCSTENPEGAKFCIQCATSFKRRCQKCGSENPPEARFCAQCAISLSAEAGQPSKATAGAAPSGIRVAVESSEPHALEGERKTVTALFADIKGSTELMEDLDPEEARAIIDPALRVMIDAVNRYGGYVVQSTGDGIFAMFGAPAAYEDHAQRALYAALQMQEDLAAYRQQRVRQDISPLEARVGVNTGEVVVRTVETGGKSEYTPIGHTANFAARLQTAAPCGSIAISEHTRRLTDGYFELRPLGPVAFKGIADSVNIYEVMGRGRLRTHFELATRRGLTRFVGRVDELQQLERALSLSREGRGQLVAVVAEAGSGKSRLFHEFKSTLPSVCKLLEAYSVSHGRASSWLPVLDLVRGYFGFLANDDAAARRARIRDFVNNLDAALAASLPYLFALLGIQDNPDPLAQMDPRVKRQRTLDTLKRIVIRESLKQPLVIIFEDLHWIDAETQAFLDLLADSVTNARILLLFNYRPEYRHDWAHKAIYSQLRLDPLNQSDAGIMLSALLGDAREVALLKRVIIERTGGNPFFIEEMVQTLFDERALTRDGPVRVARPLAQLQLPPNVQGILAARIDRLPAADKDLLQILAVIGREAPLALIRQVAAIADDRLESTLSALCSAEFVYEQPGKDIQYVFKHALTQQAAYESLLIERRKQLHERAGQALEAIFADHLDDHLGELARHYNHSDNVCESNRISRARRPASHTAQ